MIEFFIELVRLRRAPQDLPASWPLLGLILAVNLPVSLVGTGQLFGGPWPAIQAYLIDTVIVLGLIWFVLRVGDKQPRFVQTVTGYLGISLLFGVAALPLHLLAAVTLLQPLIGLAQLALVAWAHVAFGHVLRHALEVDLWVGVLIAIGFTLVELSVVYQIVPPATLGGS